MTAAFTSTNPCGLDGIDFVELAGPEPDALHRLLVGFGFARTMHHPRRAIDLYQQHDITMLLHRGPGFATRFAAAHGPAITGMGWRTSDAAAAAAAAVSRGARPADGDLARDGRPVPAVFGIGDSLLYFVDGYRAAERWAALGFVAHPQPVVVADKGFLAIDHLTNNVPKGELATWGRFYQDVFGFTEVRYFDIRGVQTGLTSYALRSPCGRFCIPINEGTEAKSQINEYLEEYKGPGVQHLAFLTADILASLRALDGSGIETLDIDADYYASVFDRVPGVTEDRGELARRNVLVDGDAEGYLLQIFTKNLIGPIFVEIIQRKNHLSFGEGNFGALFRSIERDQAKRGYL
ncbi:MAG: 4-hydroxyphenylpyruvate dioxygenase [Kofleriaceae bacterium]|nr:4-hydroxyphenylpyruvate dioxygenase [Kofleriaceae bacterium]MBP9168653.1 4-hydroxyphenylpyruvate dioxygenase [Kofleriaceae bacterium]MBP9857473.1 4-hydroxyphenylpyruvate dioxygenase [Kofleriaceae bacterium]